MTWPHLQRLFVPTEILVLLYKNTIPRFQLQMNLRLHRYTQYLEYLRPEIVHLDVKIIKFTKLELEALEAFEV